MKRIVTLMLALCMIVTMTACGAKKTPGELAAEAMPQTALWLRENVTDPTCAAVGGEWTVLGLARSGLEVPAEYFQIYRENASAYTARQGGVLHEKKYTEYSRVILGMTAIGEDPHDVGGFDLLIPLADYEKTVFQGVNGPIFALLALDSGNYDIPRNTSGGTQATRELYVDFILGAELPEGGWSFSGGEAEADMTAMALQALARYRDRKDVSDAVERGVAVLASLVTEEGGYLSYGEASSESLAQVIVALTELGISLEDERFLCKKATLVDRLLEYRKDDGSFSHTKEGQGDILATEQAFYALVAAVRASEGKPSLYTMK